MYFHFPQMHPDLLPLSWRDALPESVRFLDPGLGKAESLAHVRPEGAPFDARMAKALLADTLRFGENMGNSRDILAQSLVQQVSALAPESSRSVLRDVEQSILGAAPGGLENLDALGNARRQAQMLLLLAWNLEDRLLELRGIEAGLKTSWERLGLSVTAGADAEGDELDHEAQALGRELSGQAMPESSSIPLPWRKLVECFAVLTNGVPLVTADAEIGSAFAEDGIPEAPLTEVPGAVRVFCAPAWRCMGLDRVPEGKPWLDASLTFGVFEPLCVEG